MISSAAYQIISRQVKKGLRKPRPVRYSHPKKQSMSVRILDLIEERGGMTGAQIKRTLWEWSHPGETFDVKKDRNWWATNLYGVSRGSGAHNGLLHIFCDRQGNRWVRNALPHNDKPWATARKKKKSAWQRVNSWDQSGNIVMQLAYNINSRDVI